MKTTAVPAQRCFLFLWMLSVVAVAAAEPRAISPAEEAATRLVVAHLESGPAAFWDATTAASRFRQLGRDEGIKEVAFRTGPGEGSEWELITTARGTAESAAAFHVTFPSGVDDTLLFTMAQEGGAWKLADLRSLSDATAPVAAKAATEAVPAVVERPSPLLMASGLVALLCGALSVALRRSSKMITGLLAGTSVLAFAAFGKQFYLRHFATTNEPRVVAASVLASSPEDSRATLVELRRRVASGEELAPDAAKGLDPAAADRVALWSAQLHLQRNDAAGVARILEGVKSRNESPLAQVLAGRMAFLQNRDVDAVIAYERAMELGAAHDNLLYEAASTLMNLGFRDRAEGYFRRLAELGSREADAYYSLAIIEAMDGATEAAEGNLLTAYRMRPELRSSVVRVGMLYSLLRRPAVRKQFALHQSEEPLIRPAHFAERPLTIPPGTAARCLGEHLEVDLLGSTLQIPGGALFAPAVTPMLDAGAWDRSEASRAMSSTASLARVASQPSTYAQPALARRITETASALAAHHRWNEVVQLTSGIEPSFDLVPPDLLLMKVQAHNRTGQPDTARAFLSKMISRPTLLKRLDGRQLLKAGELLASVQSYDLAIRLMERAGQMTELPYLDDRIRQLTMNQRLAGFSMHETEHFAIRYSEETGPLGAKNLGDIAEAELKRLRRWIPTRDFKPVVINVISWQTFRGVYTGSDHVLGFYNGQITIPFAQVGYFPPEIVAILSHELAHAMIAQATRDQAPRWFQEGLAQRVESVPFQANPFNMYERESLLAFALLDDVVNYSPDPAMIGQGYQVSHALIRYVESRWGQAGLGKLFGAFAGGATTEEAIEALSGGSLAEFDRAFADWGHSKREVFENTDLVSYMKDDTIEVGRRR